jgi:hypothetical protein
MLGSSAKRLNAKRADHSYLSQGFDTCEKPVSPGDTLRRLPRDSIVVRASAARPLQTSTL